MPRVFIETTIPSYYYESRTDLRSRDWHNQTRTWWDNYRDSYELCSSELVVSEFQRSPVAKSSHAAKFFSEIEIAKSPPELEAIMQTYLEHRLMPRDATGDAAHLAMASILRTDFLLTWNCQHLANANKQRHIHVINGRLGLPTPMITTPFALIPEV